MKALQFKFPGLLEVVEKNFPLCGEEELLIKVESCGVCGTDFHIYHGTAPAKTNTILGHEFSGVVVEKGNECGGFSIGDKVAIDPNIYCGRCSYCREGKVQFCMNHRALGVTQDGGFAEFVLVPVQQAYKIPSDFPLDIASFAEPLSCCIRGIDRAKIKPGENVIIIGGGAIGLMMMQLARISGAAKLIVIEPDKYRRELALKLGADFVFAPDVENLFHSIKGITNGGADTIIECVGKPEAVELGIELTGRGGKIVVFGLAPVNSKIELYLQEAFRKELSIKTSFLNPYTFERAVELLINKKIDVEKFTITKVNLDNLTKVFAQGNNRQILKYQFQNQ
ncbi:MAG: zinc-dependent alcohol dehydrogenase family protein [Ignavibacteriales bacterium]|nr:zinc-dependent alcohol dehydrogenase family protein [Ignavibacteriales bacterium]